jgi:hypothetical protein
LEEDNRVIPGHKLDPRSSFLDRAFDPLSYSLPIRAAPRHRVVLTGQPAAAGNGGGGGGAASPSAGGQRGVMRTWDSRGTSAAFDDVRAPAAAVVSSITDSAGRAADAAFLPPAGRYYTPPFYGPLISDGGDWEGGSDAVGETAAGVGEGDGLRKLERLGVNTGEGDAPPPARPPAPSAAPVSPAVASGTPAAAASRRR